MAREPLSGSDSDKLTRLMERLAALDGERASLAAEIESLQAANESRRRSLDGDKLDGAVRTRADLNSQSPAPSKIKLFRRLFLGRADVFPLRWENSKTGRSGYSPACANEWRRGICDKPRSKYRRAISIHRRGRCGDRAPSSGSLAGRFTFIDSVYPPRRTTIVGFSPPTSMRENGVKRMISAFAETCLESNLCGHRAVSLRQQRTRLDFLRGCAYQQYLPGLSPSPDFMTMERLPDIGFKSNDRHFPSQDKTPSGSFGNLIALPLQGRARAARNSIFVDDTFMPHPDQWVFLASLDLLPPARVEGMILEATVSGKLLPVRTPLIDDDEEPWLAPLIQSTPRLIDGRVPKKLTVGSADQLSFRVRSASTTLIHTASSRQRFKLSSSTSAPGYAVAER